MTALVWDQAGERRYETGIDRGVLYLPDGNSVAWNGLTSVIEGRSSEVKSYFMDGIKYLDHKVPGAYSAKLQAFTYPDELDLLLGNMEIAPGVVAYDQRASVFNLSYRTRIANDLEGMDYAYKIHLIYNLIASQSDVNFDTVAESFSAKPFEWSLTGTPNTMFGMRPTSHISVDSRTVNPSALAELETQLYGSDTVDPSIPPLDALLAMVT